MIEVYRSHQKKQGLEVNIMDIELQLPVWLVKEINKHSTKSTQYMIKKILKDVMESEEGDVIIRRILGKD